MTEQPQQSPELTEEHLAELRAMFDLARAGDPRLPEYVDMGLPVNLTNGVGDTLLILAAYYKQADLVGALVSRGADLERENDRGQTALGCAVFRQHDEVVELLLSAGADPDGGTQSARQVAEFFGLDAMRELLDLSARS